ncbi:MULTISPECIES: hypothetical protein [Alphaproteobacteria]|uniref:hypothetical protein n=1 Tax=Alphaproteobacteria TaxID=28211 RepID=UPI003263A9D8
MKFKIEDIVVMPYDIDMGDVESATPVRTYSVKRHSNGDLKDYDEDDLRHVPMQKERFQKKSFYWVIETRWTGKTHVLVNQAYRNCGRRIKDA